jgi:cytochrome P450
MLTAEEKTRPAGDPLAALANGSKPRESPLERAPGPSSWRGLPRGPLMPNPLPALGFWYRRNPFFERCRRRYGTPFTISMRYPPVPFVVFSDPDHIKAIFHAPPEVLWAGDGSNELHKYFGSPGLAYLEEDEHLARRKLLNRSTHGEAMRQISASVDSVIERELASWPRDELIELFPRFLRLAVEVVRHVNFGTEPDERLDELVEVVIEIMRTAERPVAAADDLYLSPRVLRVLAAIRPLGYRQILELCGRADRLIYDVIEDRRRAGDAEGHDTLSVLLSATNEDGSPLSTVEIRNEMMTNFIAGSSTTSASMAWAVERLSREPAVRERLVDEIDAGEDDAYLTATVRELLRRKPPLPQVIPRLVVEPFELDGFRFAPGVRLLASAYLVHHDPSIYPDPYAFRPERFLENGPGAYTWIPFGGGRRRCLGKGIAELEIKAALRGVFKQFEIRPDSPEPERERSLHGALRPARGARVTLSERP